MKKKFLTIISLLFSLTVLAGCNATAKDGESSEQPTTSIEPCERHTWGKAETISEPTCTQPGQTQRTCEVCGAKEDPKTIKALGHKYDDGKITTPATCSTPGVKTFTCERCGDTTTEEVKADHTWGAATDLTVGDSDALVKEFTCTECGKKKLEFAGKQAADRCTLNGALKSDSQFPDYLKLDSNDELRQYYLNHINYLN